MRQIPDQPVRQARSAVFLERGVGEIEGAQQLQQASVPIQIAVDPSKRRRVGHVRLTSVGVDISATYSALGRVQVWATSRVCLRAKPYKNRLKINSLAAQQRKRVSDAPFIWSVLRGLRRACDNPCHY